MLKFDEPSSPTLVGGKPMPLRVYLDQVILPLPFWRSTDEACKMAEEIFEAIDKIEGGAASSYVLRNATQEALQKQMTLADTVIIQQNPHLARCSIRYCRIVNQAEKYEDPEP